MKHRSHLLLAAAGFAALLSVTLCDAPRVAGQDNKQPSTPATKDPPSTATITRLTIEVTGGESNKPIENASVYLKTLEQKLLKDKKFEVNVKTNMQGVAHVPEAPLGRVLVQVVVPGWKPFGHWFDVTDPQQTIKVHLERPPKWY